MPRTLTLKKSSHKTDNVEINVLKRQIEQLKKQTNTSKTDIKLKKENEKLKNTLKKCNKVLEENKNLEEVIAQADNIISDLRSTKTPEVIYKEIFVDKKDEEKANEIVEKVEQNKFKEQGDKLSNSVKKKVRKRKKKLLPKWK